MPLTMPMSKAIFISVLHKHRQDCIRSLDVSLSMTSLKSGAECIMWLASKVRLTLTFKSAVSLTKLHFKFQNSKHKPNVSFCLSMHYIYVTINCKIYISLHLRDLSSYFSSSGLTVLHEPCPLPKLPSTVLGPSTYLSSSSRLSSLDLPQLNQATST